MQCGVNDEGRVVGEHHHRARLTDRDVWLILELRKIGMSYGHIAHKFDISKTHVIDLCMFRRRAHTVAGHKEKVAYGR